MIDVGISWSFRNRPLKPAKAWVLWARGFSNLNQILRRGPIQVAGQPSKSTWCHFEIENSWQKICYGLRRDQPSQPTEPQQSLAWWWFNHGDHLLTLLEASWPWWMIVDWTWLDHWFDWWCREKHRVGNLREIMPDSNRSRWGQMRHGEATTPTAPVCNGCSRFNKQESTRLNKLKARCTPRALMFISMREIDKMSRSIISQDDVRNPKVSMHNSAFMNNTKVFQ